jgi:hypothetical protein
MMRCRFPAARDRLARVGLVVLVGLGAACSTTRVDSPIPTVPDDAPQVVAPPDDPADDPQLAAVSLPEDAPGVTTPDAAAGIDVRIDDVARLERLPVLVGLVGAEIGPDAEVCALVAGTRAAVKVPRGDTVVEYRLGSEDGRDTLVLAQALASTPCDRPFVLDGPDGPDYAVPGRLLVGALERVPGARLSDVTLADDGEWGLVWRVRVTRGGASQSIVAVPSGAVLAVTA